MKKTRRRLSEYWDKVVLKTIPPYAKFRKIESEIKEHFNFVGWMSKRILFPLIIFYVVIGIILNINIFGPLFVMLLVFIYSNFLPDIDFLIKKTRSEDKESLWYERYSLLFFAPMIIYYVIAGRARPLYSVRERCFHNLKTMLVYGGFLFIVGSVFWTENVKIIMLSIFGMLGFAFHLMVDKKLKVD